MGYEKGSNEAGVNGILDITGTGKQYHVKVDGFSKDSMLSRISRNGRGNTGYALSRVAFDVTKITVYGKDHLDSWPEPTSNRTNGSLTIQMGTDPSGTVARKVTYSVSVDASSYKYDSAKQTDWSHSVALDVVGAPTYAGWEGNQPTATPPTLADLQLYDGTVKAIDPQGLATTATRVTDVVGVADTDAGESGKLTTMAGAATTPITGLKLRDIHFARTDKDGGKVTEAWAYRSTKDDIQYDGSEVSCGVTNGANWERVVTIESCSSGDTIEALAQTAHTALKGTTSPTQAIAYNNVRARRYHATAWIKTVTYEPRQSVSLPPTDKCRISGRIGSIVQKVWVGLDDSTPPVPSVFVASSRSRGTGKYLVQLAPFDAIGIGGPFIVRQRITASAPTLGTSSINKTNNAVFFGFPIGSMMYLGASYDVIVSDTNSTYDMEYTFQLFMSEQCKGFPTLMGVPPGGAIISTSDYDPGFVQGSGSGTSYTWSALGLSLKLPSTDALNFTTWNQ